MSVSSVGNAKSVAPIEKAAPPPAAKEPTLPQDKVSISPEAAKLASGSDQDHDGDAQ